MLNATPLRSHSTPDPDQPPLPPDNDPPPEEQPVPEQPPIEEPQPKPLPIQAGRENS